jgi:hypothetical protein
MNLRGLAIAVFLASLTFASAVGVTPIDQMQADLSALKDQANRDAQWKAEQAAALADLLARQIALAAELNQGSKKEAADWVAAADKIHVQKDLRQAADEIKSGFNSLPAELKGSMEKCVGASADVKAANSDNPNFDLPGCDKSSREALKEKLQSLENEAKKAYDDCRLTIEQDAREYRDLLPKNASDNIDPKSLSALKQYPNKRIRECADEVKKAVDELKDVRDAKALVSNALTMAANVCFASGGNPWVCGGMLAIALIMEIFDGGGGGGKSDGPGKGPPGGAGGGSAPTVSAGPPSEGKSAGEARNAAASSEVSQGPSTNLGKTANLGDPNVKSDAYCNAAAGQVVCFLQSTPGSEVFFSGDSRIALLSQTPHPGAVTVCTDKGGKISAIVVAEGAKQFLYVHNDSGTLPADTVATASEGCAKVK